MLILYFLEIDASQDFLRAKFLDQLIEMFLFTGFKPDKPVCDILLIRKKIVLTFFTNTCLLFHRIVFLISSDKITPFAVINSGLTNKVISFSIPK
jgi:hypothetical protein